MPFQLAWGLQQNPGRLRVQTLDSLNAQISRMQPLTTSAATVGNNVLSESGMVEHYELAAAAVLEHLAGDSPFADAVESVLSHLDNDSSRFIRHLAEMKLRPLSGFRSIGLIGKSFSILHRAKRTSSILRKLSLLTKLRLFHCPWCEP